MDKELIAKARRWQRDREDYIRKAEELENIIRANTPHTEELSTIGDVLSEMGHYLQSRETREAFLCALLVVYSPQSMYGISVTTGFRKVLTEYLGVTGGGISRMVNVVSFYYVQFDEFSQIVDAYADSIIQYIKK